MSPSNSQLSTLNSPLIPPGYKQTEVGVIPEEWDESPVADVITSFQNGFAFASHGYVKSGIPIVTMAQIGLDGRFHFTPESVNYWPAEAASALLAFQLFRGDIIIAMTDVTPQKNLIGRMAEVTEIGPLLLNQRVGLLRLDSEKIDPYFLRAISNSSRGYARAVASLGVQANIGTKDIRAGKIPLPPLPEQRAIAEALSDVDGLLGGLDRLIAKKRDLKQAAMQQLLTGQTRQTGFHGLPGAWEVKRLRDIVQCSPSGTYGVERQTPTLLPMPVATTAQISDTDRWNGKACKHDFSLPCRWQLTESYVVIWWL